MMENRWKMRLFPFSRRDGVPTPLFEGGSTMIRKHVLALFAVGATLTSAFLGCQGIAQNGRSNWSAKGVTARFRNEIDGQGFGDWGGSVEPKPGSRILEISGTFSAKTEPYLVTLQDIFISPGSTPTSEKERWSIESMGAHLGGTCSHVVVGPLLGGVVSVVSGGEEKGAKFSVRLGGGEKFREITTEKSGFGAVKWAIGKETESGPWQAKFYQDPTPLCVAFGIPENVSRNVTLHFGDVTVPVVVPAAK
jgi:hypothetical protein